MSAKKVIISACLLGENCRYDGKTKINQTILDAYKAWEIIPFCPEAPLFGTPRERINVIREDKSDKIITDKNSTDVTKLLEKEILSFTDQYPHVDEIVLKSKSPSCGVGTTPILDKGKNIIDYGDGIAAAIMKKKYFTIDIKDENKV